MHPHPRTLKTREYAVLILVGARRRQQVYDAPGKGSQRNKQQDMSKPHSQVFLMCRKGTSKQASVRQSLCCRKSRHGRKEGDGQGKSGRTILLAASHNPTRVDRDQGLLRLEKVNEACRLDKQQWPLQWSLFFPLPLNYVPGARVSREWPGEDGGST